MTLTGLQLYSVREYAENDLLNTINTVAEQGYDAVQFAGFFGHSSNDIKQELKHSNIQVAGSHTSWEELTKENLLQTITFNKSIGNDLIICPSIPNQYRQSINSYKAVAEKLNNIGSFCHEHDMTFAYHNHAFEFELLDETIGYNILLTDTDPNLVKFELDCFWVIYAGYDPSEILQKYKDRFVSLHLKDMMKQNKQMISCEINEGLLDIQQQFKDGRHANVKYFIIEQEDFRDDPMKIAQRNILYFKKLLE